MRLHGTVILLIASFAFAGAAMKSSAAATVYVAPNGDDSWSGSLAEPNSAGTDGPLATLAKAQTAVRQTRKQHPDEAVNVIVRGGTYALATTLEFSQADSGTAENPTIWHAAHGENVLLHGGRTVAGWKPWRDGIYQSDLAAQGMAGVEFHQLFWQGKRQPLARHPNVDPEHPRTGGFAYMQAAGPRPREQFFYEAGSIPLDRWSDLSQAEVVSLFGLGWNFAIVPIAEVDRQNQLITTSREVRRPFEPENRFFIQNVLDALDAPGEWYHDRKSNVLYFRPPEGPLGNSDVIVPLIDHLIELRGSIPYPHGYLKVGYTGTKSDFKWDAPDPAAPVEHVTLRGFYLRYARQDAVRMVGAKDCAVVGCSISNVGNVGVNLGGVASAHLEVGNPRVAEAEGFSAGVGGGGQNLLFQDPCQQCAVDGNDIHQVGSDGIFLYGTGNTAQNNHVYDIGLFDKDCACINTFGEENQIVRNTLHDVPRNAVFLKGVDNTVGWNDIRRTMLETCDGGAIRMCQRNVALRGNKICSNRILDTFGYGYPRGGDYQCPYFSWGVYLDDYTCGTTVVGNMVARCGRGGIHVHGGSDNLIENNVVVDGGLYQFENNPIRPPVTGNLVRTNIFSYTNPEAYLYRCGRDIDGAVRWENNLVDCPAGDDQPRILLGLPNVVEGWSNWLAKGLETGSVRAKPLFENSSADDYRLKPDSPAWDLGFDKIPVDQIGCYASNERASWPLSVDPSLVTNETPVLRKRPVRPVQEDFEWDLVGRPPRAGDVSAPPKSSIRVTDKLAADGTKSLQFVDAADLPQRWQPRLYYGTNWQEGTARFSCDLQIDGRQPPTLIIDIRQYRDTGGREYLSGPYLSISPQGELTTGGKPLVTVPLDQWFHLDVTIALGDAADGHYELTVTLPDGRPQRFRLACRSPEFRSLDRIVLMSNGDGPAVFYLDNVFCGPAEDLPGKK